MAYLPPVGWADVATRADLDGTTHQLRAEIAELRTELRTEIAELRDEVRTEIAELRDELRTGAAELRVEMAGLRTEVERGLRRQTITTIVTMTAIVSAIATATNLFG